MSGVSRRDSLVLLLLTLGGCELLPQPPRRPETPQERAA